MTGRWWRMTVGPAATAIRTPLDLDSVVDGLWACGESVLYTLEPHPVRDADDVSATVVHDLTSGPAGCGYDAHGRTLRIWADRTDLSGADLLYLSYLALEAELNRFGFVTLHAAAVERDGRAALLLGTAGAGKTTTALRLCRDHGCRLVGNDLVVAGGRETVHALVGTTHLRLRHCSVRRALPELFDVVPGLFPGSPRDIADPWRTKVDVSPEHLSVRAANTPCEITTVVFVHVDPDYAQVVTAPGDTLVHRLNLHENALRYVRAASTPWLVGAARQFGPYVPSFDDPLAYQARTATLTRMFSRSSYIAGPPAAVADEVAALLATKPTAPPAALAQVASTQSTDGRTA